MDLDILPPGPSFLSHGGESQSRATANKNGISGRSQANRSPIPPLHARYEEQGYPRLSPSAPSASTSTSSLTDLNATGALLTGTRKMRKRKANGQENERLSKRLSLLNLEQGGPKLYVPVESPRLQPTSSTSLKQVPENEGMQLEYADSKHKVYIYDLDAELSDSGESDDGRLVFLPDIEKHLFQKRIPPSVLANKDGELAGMQLVLYSEPTSLTVPEEQDSVRKAILEARARLRRRQRGEEEEEEKLDVVAEAHTNSTTTSREGPTSTLRVLNGLKDLANDHTRHTSATATTTTITNGHYWAGVPESANDPDAMELD